MSDNEPIFENLPVHLNLADSFAAPMSVIGWATSFRDPKSGRSTITIVLDEEASDKLANMAEVFELKALGFAGIKKNPKFTSEQRQAVLLEAINQQGWLDADAAWRIGHTKGFYKGGDGGLAKEDLRALSQQGKATAHDGFWRHAHEPDHIRNRHQHWADYWTPKTRD